MAWWCNQASCHYLNQCWSRSMFPYSVTKTQWVKENTNILLHISDHSKCMIYLIPRHLYHRISSKTLIFPADMGQLYFNFYGFQFHKLTESLQTTASQVFLTITVVCHNTRNLTTTVTHALEIEFSLMDYTYRKVPNISGTKSPNLNVSHFILQLPLPNPMKPGVKSRAKM